MLNFICKKSNQTTQPNESSDIDTDRVNGQRSLINRQLKITTKKPM